MESDNYRCEADIPRRDLKLKSENLYAINQGHKMLQMNTQNQHSNQKAIYRRFNVRHEN